MSEQQLLVHGRGVVDEALHKFLTSRVFVLWGSSHAGVCPSTYKGAQIRFGPPHLSWLAHGRRGSLEKDRSTCMLNKLGHSEPTEETRGI